MINHDDQLKLQAYLDGELSEQDTAGVKAWLTSNVEAQQLLAELQNTSAALTGHEAEIKLPETHDFFWSKIKRDIQQQERRPLAESPKPTWADWLLRRFAPVGGLAAVAVTLVLVYVNSGQGVPKQFGEMELASDDMGAYTYRDQAQQLTMVWFYDQPDSQFTQTEPAVSMDQE